MELDFDKYCILDSSPTTVLPHIKRRSKVSNRKSNGNLKCGNDVLFNEDFIEIGFNRYRSASCRDAKPRRSNNDLLKRGSVYQSSKEVTFLKKSDIEGGRTKIEFSRESNSSFSFGIDVVGSLCSLDENEALVEEQSNFIEMSLSEQRRLSVCKHAIGLHSKKHSFHPITERLEYGASPMNNGNSLEERSTAMNLHKSLSAKLALPHSPTQSESDGSKSSSPKSRFSPVRKIFDPFVKSKSLRSPLSSVKENGRETTNKDKTTISKSLLSVLSDLVEHDSLLEKKENSNLLPEHSPAHLHAVLKLENKNGVPFFEFSVQSPEEFYVAKVWKVENDLNWVYTFHMPHHKRKSNANGWGFKEIHRESTKLGQMCVSCYLCTELQANGDFEDSMVTEFVSYDISHSRKSTSCQENSASSPVVKESDEMLSWGNCEQHGNSVKTKNEVQFKNSRESMHFDSSTFQPLAVADLNPGLETAAIIMKIPFEKRESLKLKTEDRKNDNLLPNLLDICQTKGGIVEKSSDGKMHVVIPSGNHSLPSDESHEPSPLIDRWHLGGGCDCGGWDMGCPINIFGNPNIRIAEGSTLMDNQHPAELFLQGGKDKLPAFSMRTIENGKYAVDFHAQLSSLQAFSTCVAILHAAEASTVVGQERTKQIFQSDSMRVFPEEEIKNLIDAIAEEEKLKLHRRTEEVLPSFVGNPPFSPIARV